MSARRVAIDLGASSGRVAVGTIVDGRLEFEIVHRFENSPYTSPNGPVWDFDRLYEEAVRGLMIAGQAGEVASVGVDSWAVDYALISDDGDIMADLYCYRHPRTDGVLDRLSDDEKEMITRLTGLQLLPFNTLFQLKCATDDLEGADNQMFLIPDVFHNMMTSYRGTEYTNASTTQMLSPVTGKWIPELLEWCGVSEEFMPEIFPPGTNIGELSFRFKSAAGLAKTEVILPATHDTASAVLAVPMEDPEACAYVSSGTWSLVGVELAAPLMEGNEGWSNEGGAFGTTRLLKNMMGLWILQECARAWDLQDWDALIESSKPFLREAKAFDPDLPKFLAPGPDMPDRVISEIGDACQAEVVAAILVSLAEKTVLLVRDVARVTNRKITTIHIVGGGSQNSVLNQLIADRSGLQVVAGPVEATLMGNLLMQFHAAGDLEGDSIRDVVRRSSQLISFEPKP
ncbi:MAG: FGGY-family carbohydrate kinase [Armatimonadota bacterium]